MKTEKITLPICEMYKSRGMVNLSPPYQRGGGVWNGPKRKDLIYSILCGYDLPKFYIHANGSIWDVVDGKQRLTTIFDFLEDGFPLNSRIKEFNRQRYSQLPADTREAINRYQLDLTIVTECGTDQIREMFLLHQQGSPLTSSERRNAIGGWLHGEVNRLAEHPYFTQCAGFANRRFKHQHVIASCFLLETVGKAAGTGHVALRNLYTSLKVQTEAGRTTLAKVNAAYDLLGDVFKPVPGLALSAGATIALYWLVASNGTRAREL